MSLYQQIQDDIKTAMRGRDAKTLDVLRLLFASLKNKAIDLKRELEDAEVIATVRSDIKKLGDAIQDFQKGAREDLVTKTNEEIELLRTYLPPEMSDVDLKEVISKKITDMDATDFKQIGQVMGAVMADVKDKVDGSRVKKMVEELLKKATSPES